MSDAVLKRQTPGEIRGLIGHVILDRGDRWSLKIVYRDEQGLLTARYIATVKPAAEKRFR